MKAYGDKVYTNFRGLNVQEYGVEYESFAIISIASLLIYRNLQSIYTNLQISPASIFRQLCL